MVHLILDLEYLRDGAMGVNGVHKIKPTVPYDRIFILAEKGAGTAVNPLEQDGGWLYDWLNDVTSRNDHFNSYEIHVVINKMSPRIAAWAASTIAIASFGTDQYRKGFETAVWNAEGGNPRCEVEERNWKFAVFEIVDGVPQKIIGDTLD